MNTPTPQLSEMDRLIEMMKAQNETITDLSTNLLYAVSSMRGHGKKSEHDYDDEYDTYLHRRGSHRRGDIDNPYRPTSLRALDALTPDLHSHDIHEFELEEQHVEKVFEDLGRVVDAIFGKKLKAGIEGFSKAFTKVFGPDGQKQVAKIGDTIQTNQKFSYKPVKKPQETKVEPVKKVYQAIEAPLPQEHEKFSYKPVKKPQETKVEPVKKVYRAVEAPLPQEPAPPVVIPNSQKPLKEQTGFTAAMRRGIVDPHGDLGPEKGVVGHVGRFVGSLMGGKNLSYKEREAHAAASYHSDLEHERALSDEPNKILPHEERQVSLLSKRVNMGMVDTGGLSNEEYVNKAKEDLVASNRLNALRKKSPTEKPEYQAELLAKLYPQNAPQAASVTTNPVVNGKAAASPIASQVTPVSGMDSVNVNTMTVQQLIAPSAVKEKEEEPLSPLLQVLENIKQNSDYEAQYGKEIPIPAPFTESQVAAASVVRNPSAPAPLLAPDRTPDAGKLVTDKAEEYTPEHQSAPVAPQPVATPKPTQVIAKATLDKKQEFDSVVIKALTIQQLTMPDSGKDEAAPESPSMPSIDLPDLGGNSPKGKGKIAKALNFGGKLLGKLAMPLAIASASTDAISGYSNTKDNLGIEGREATFGEKMSSAAGSMASGLTFGLLDEKTASKGISSFFGAGPDITPVSADKLTPSNEGNAGTLRNLKEENAQLLQEEKESTSKSINVVSPTTINNMSGGGSAPVMATFTRPSHSAYERFVDRVFSAV